MPGKHSVFAKNPDIITRLIKDETVLLSLDSGIYYSLKGPGSSIWEMLDGKRTVEDIAAGVAGEYDVDSETALNDAIELIGDLANEGLASEV